ncbi:MAG TPA: hypothetical protein VE153_00225 [Myxococcus sp.]|nr:hypothetical protein [Myxococcus sp.]
MELLKQLDAWITFITGATWFIVLIFTIRHYARPRISYFREMIRPQAWQFIIKHFDSVIVDDPLVIDVTATGGIQRIEVSSGPWLTGFSPPQATSSTAPIDRVSLTFGGVPAEGVFAVTVTTVGSIPSLSINSDSKVRPRAFKEAKKWGNARILPLVFKAALGFISAAFAYSLGEWLITEGIQYFFEITFTNESLGLIEGFGFWNMLVLVWLGLLSVSSYVLTSPFAGKETIRGYLGNRDAKDNLSKLWP